MKKFAFDVKAVLYIRAKTIDEARKKAMKYDCEDDYIHYIGLDRLEVDVDSGKLVNEVTIE